MYDALILCGGLGTRFQSVSTSKPKSLASINGKPIIEILTDQLVKQGISKIILCVGHLAKQVIEYYENKKDADYIFSIENAPLGTGGAIFNAFDKIKSDYFFVLNGDSFCDIEFSKFLNFHKDRNSFLSLVGAQINDASDYGVLSIDSENRILKFEEKSKSGKAVINAGIYLLPKNIFSVQYDLKPLSLEKELFPNLIHLEKCYTYVVETDVFDIGTKERYEKAQDLIKI